jgi:site-specific DNA-methyltransferase (adenine-specific)
LPNESVDTIITDCPFAIENGKPETLNYNRDSVNVMEGYHEIALADYALFSNQWIQKAYSKLTKHGTLIIVSSWSNQRDILNAINENNFYLQNEIIWRYNFGLFTKRKFVSSHYKIFFCSKHKTKFTFNKPIWYCEDIMTTEYDEKMEIFEIPREYWKGLIKTPNKLPKELVEMLVFIFSNPDDIVLDCFSGSGTILKVGSYMGRYVLAFEIVKTFADFSNFRLAELNY